MAQPPPPPPPPLGGRQFLERILHPAYHGITTMLLQNLNLFDYMNLRTRLNSRILDTVDPAQLFNQNRAPLLAPPAAPTGAATVNAPAVGPADYLRRNLGAHCNDNRYVTGQHVPCTNGPMSMVRMEPCKHANPTGAAPNNPAPHAPFPIGTFNVCDPCNQSWRARARVEVARRITPKRAILCKSHSLSLRRRDQITPVRGCACARDITAGHKCSACRLQTELSTYAVGDARMDVLKRTHVSYKEKGRKGRKTLVVRPDFPRFRRTRAACPEPGCGKKPWTKHYEHRRRALAQGIDEPDVSKHAEAGLFCLCCSQGII